MAPDPAEDLALLTGVAALAGPMALARFKTDVAVWDKPGQGPVTDADLEIDEMVRETLCAARPDYGWLSEESVDPRSFTDRDRIFIVDPIDGTRAFLAGEQGWGTALAVVERGRVVAAVMHLPARGETYAAAVGKGATLNGRPIAASSTAALSGATALAARTQLKPELWPGGAPPVDRHYRPSLAWRMCLVARGRFDLMVTLRPAYEWDIAAGCLIATEAGAKVTDGDGGELVFNRHPNRATGVIVAPRSLHDELMDLRMPARAD